MEKYYEHHNSIKSNKLCPFKLAKGETADVSFYNWHENIEIVYVAEGQGYFHYDSDAFLVSEGDIVVVNSGTIHRPPPNVLFYYLIIDEGFCSENGLSVMGIEFESVLRDPECVRIFLDVSKRLEEHSLSEGGLSAACVRQAVLSLLIYLCSHHMRRKRADAVQQAPSASCVKSALAIINDHYADGLTLDGIASKCGVTKHHLAREFKRQTGQTVITYINVLRCKRAALSIAEGVSITEAAMECGFESLSYFSRTYKRIIGVLPSLAKRDKAQTVHNKLSTNKE